MRKKWKEFTACLPKWPRKWRAIRNLAVAGLVLLLLPWILEWPVFTAEQAFRQLEQRALLTPSKIVLRVGDSFLSEGEDWVTVGKVETYDSSWKPFQRKLAFINNVEPKEGLIVVAIPEVVDGILTVAVTGLPERAVSGTLSLTVSGVRDTFEFLTMKPEETFAASAVRQGEWMFFELKAHDHGENGVCILERLWTELTMGYGVDRFPYTLELCGGSREQIGLVSGTLPQSLQFLDSRL